MKLKRILLACLMMALVPTQVFALSTEVRLAIWSNEAIISAYTFDYKNLIQRQKETAQYFIPKAWMTFSREQISAGIIQAVKKNYYSVSSVATSPPVIQQTTAANGDKGWSVSLPIIVVYKNAQFQQKQFLSVNLTAIASQQYGTRGFAIVQFSAKNRKPPKCDNETNTIKATTPKKDATKSPTKKK